MKFRRDFVTNSSSSSFIIGKSGDNIDKNTVYNLVKGVYSEFYALKDKIMPVAKDYGIQWNEERQCFTYIKFGALTDELRAERREINARLKSDFDAELYDLDFSYNFDWLSCETYNDFLKYYQGLGGFERDTYYPFELVDFEKDNVMPNNETFDESFDYQELVDWYLPCILFPCNDMYFDLDGNYVGSCKYCVFKNDKEACEKFKAEEKSGKYTKATLIGKVVGKIGVLSYCGRIPDYVVEHLGAKSIVYCNHMG